MTSGRIDIGTHGWQLWVPTPGFVLVSFFVAIDPICRRGAGAVERGGLENRCPSYRGTEGSNPSLSAIYEYNIELQQIVMGIIPKITHTATHDDLVDVGGFP
jgi:hypothetical protein